MTHNKQLWMYRFDLNDNGQYVCVSTRQVGHKQRSQAPRFVQKYMAMGSGLTYPEQTLSTLKTDSTLLRVTKKGGSFFLTYAVPVPNKAQAKTAWNSIKNLNGVMKFFGARTLASLHEKVAQFTDCKARITLLGQDGPLSSDAANSDNVIGFFLTTPCEVHGCLLDLKTERFYFPISYEKMLYAADAIDDKYYDNTSGADEDAIILAAVA